jgi:HSP20 family protein
MRHHDPRGWMLSEAIELLQTAGRLQRQFFQIGQNNAMPCWEPPIDMYGGDDELCVLVAMPGVAPGRFEVALEHASIVVRGERALGAILGPGAIFHLEIPYGCFERRIDLPDGAYRMIDMQLENGCLRLQLGRLK